ncbi:MAG: radical SAM protein [Elusimicrobia bacterium]|nr:radical SAM protein [Elusimicrobiota bacterium]
MKFALVFNPFSYKVHEENLRIVQKYFGLFPPLSLAWVAAIAQRAGHETIIIDARTLRLTMEDTLERLKEFKPDILGFMMTTYMFPETLGWIRYLKKRLGIPVVVGGYNLRVYPRESVAPAEIDFGVREHAYYTIPSLFEELERGRKFENVPGLIYKDGGQTLINAHPLKIDFDKFPNPARDLLPNELYAEFPTELRNFTVMVTSLGCPYDCSFCEAGSSAYSPRSPVTVVNEMEECFERHGVREIDIFDYNFTTDKIRVMEICSEIIKRKLNILWACRSRIDIDGELLEIMKAAGCGRIYYGIESGSQEILDRVNKRITLDRIRNTVKMTKKYGIRALGFFLVGAPGETKKTVSRTVRFAKSLDLDYTQFSKCLAKPLTPLWKEMVAKEGKDYWREWVLGREEDRVLPRPWTVLSNDEIDRLTRKAYVKFHLRPLFLLKAALKVRSFSEFRKKVLGFLEMMFSQEKISRKADGFVAYHGDRKRLDFYRKLAKFK